MVLNQPKRLILLDSLRGLAALIVCYHHLFKINNVFFRTNFEGTTYFLLNELSELNHEAVIFFFILSGFSIGLSLKNKELNSSETVNDYLYRRFKRILPVYWFAILITIVCGLLMHNLLLPDYNLYNLIGNLLFLQTSSSIEGTWFVPYGLNGPFWSLSYEFFFYCLFPVVFILNQKYLLKININVKFLILFILSICGFVFNKIFFLPPVAFFTSFIIWLLGYMNAKSYYLNKKYDLLFAVSFLFSTIFFLIGSKYISSNTLFVICQGLFMGALFYIGIRLHRNETIIKITKGPVKVINVLFEKIGHGSYVLYALHYPVLLVFNFIQLNIYVQIAGLAVLLILSVFIEEWAVKQKNLWLKKDYSGFIFKRFKQLT